MASYRNLTSSGSRRKQKEGTIQEVAPYSLVMENAFSSISEETQLHEISCQMTLNIGICGYLEV